MNITNTDGVWGNGEVIPIQIIRTDPYNSDKSTIDTIAQMRALVRHSANIPAILSTVQYCKATPVFYNSLRSECDLVRALYWWVKGHITFTDDESIIKTQLSQLGYMATDESLNSPNGASDLLISPEVLLSMPHPMGDCDDFSTLLGSLLVASGVRCWFVVVAVDSMEPERFSHVYLRCECKDSLGHMVSMPLDASHGKYPGWEVGQEKVFRRVEWGI